MVAHKHPLAHHVDQQKIRDAIGRAERHTTGRIALMLSHHAEDGVLHAARRAFNRLNMHRTKHRNSVLFFVVPSRRQFAVYGDAAIHDKLGQAFWDRLTPAMTERIKNEDLTAGVVYGVEEVGRQLAAHFPKDE